MIENADKKYYGFIGNLVKINLTKGSVKTEKINIEIAKRFLGGAGYACRYLLDFINKNTDPLSPENVLMIMTGPFCGTSAPSFGRFIVCSKSPYTGLWGESNCGGYFGPELKRAGYDGIIIYGKADQPVYIQIINEQVDILDASSLWGKGIKETQHSLKHASGELKSRVFCIGPAGENLVKYATINADGRSAGRTGMGAVMGSKKIKGIVVKGDKIKPHIANPEVFRETIKKTIKFILDSHATKALRGFGTSAGIMTAYSYGDLPIKYWSQGEWEEVYNISGEKLRENLLLKTRSCYGCSIGCGRIIEIEGKRSLFADCEGPEYETIAGFGSMILNSNLESIAIANNLCNDYGLDTISTSGTIAFLYDLYNKGKINKQDIDGLELNWGNSNVMIQLIKKIAYKEGIGNLLAEGSNAIGDRFNISKDEIATINNLEPPYHDIRACYGLSLTYTFSPRGPCHMSGDVYKVLREGNEIDFSSIDIKKMNLYQNNKEMAYATSKLQDYRALYSSLISCAFSNPPPKYMAELIESLLGIEIDLEKMKILGERIFNMKRLFNIKMGLTLKNDSIPKILLTPTNEGAVKGKVPDFEKLKKFYYKIRDWDPTNGKPNLNKLKELGLEDFI